MPIDFGPERLERVRDAYSKWWAGELDAIQWVPGAGNPDCAHWPEVYRKIRAAGKGILIYGGFGPLDAVILQVGKARGIAHQTHGVWGEELNEDEIRRKLAEYGS